jgi:hypothetical protein
MAGSPKQVSSNRRLCDSSRTWLASFLYCRLQCRKGLCSASDSAQPNHDLSSVCRSNDPSSSLSCPYPRNDLSRHCMAKNNWSGGWFLDILSSSFPWFQTVEADGLELVYQGSGGTCSFRRTEAVGSDWLFPRLSCWILGFIIHACEVAQVL